MNLGVTSRRGRGLALWCPRPAWVEPMRASPSEPRPLTGDWVSEPRLEGLRCLAWTSEGGVALKDASARTLDGRYPGLVAFLADACRGEAILDGVITNQGLELFDCLFYEGVTLTSLPLLDRRAVLRDAVLFGDGVHLVPFQPTTVGPAGRDAVLPAGAGVVAKRAHGRYVGGRSSDWLAFDCANAQEFVIGGYSESSECGAALALLIGYYEEGRLRYAGRVSAAYDPSSLTAMAPTLARLRRRTSPFGGAVPGGGHIQWVSPALVAQIGFTEWTPAGLPKQPRFINLRHDREPDEVCRALRG
jgi:bifunctional non-homologous end joining protein LigD